VSLLSTAARLASQLVRRCHCSPRRPVSLPNSFVGVIALHGGPSRFPTRSSVSLLSTAAGLAAQLARRCRCSPRRPVSLPNLFVGVAALNGGPSHFPACSSVLLPSTASGLAPTCSSTSPASSPANPTAFSGADFRSPTRPLSLTALLIDPSRCPTPVSASTPFSPAQPTTTAQQARYSFAYYLRARFDLLKRCHLLNLPAPTKIS
jgi:hypothetical protein